MPDFTSYEGRELVTALEGADYDPFAPMVTMSPVAGFPKTVSVQNGLGETIFISARDRLTKFVATDNDRKLDTIEITFIDEDGYFAEPANLAHGSVIDVAYGYKGRMSSERRVIVRRVQLEAMQGKASAKRRKGFIVTIEGQAPGIVGLYDDGADVEVFENTRLSAIVRMVAGRLGYHETGRGTARLEINVPPDDDLIEKVLTKPAALKTPQFLKYIADRYGFLLATSKKGMYFGIRDYAQSPGERIDAHNSTLISYKLDGDLNLPIPKGLVVSGVQKGSFKQVGFRTTVEDVAPKSNIDIASDEGDAAGTTATPASGFYEEAPNANRTPITPPTPRMATGTAVVVTKRPVSTASALRLKNTVMRDFRPVTGSKLDLVRIKRFKQRIERQWKLKITTVGNPKFVAGMIVRLVNFDTPLLDGDWYITEAKHTFDQNYTTELSMHRRRDTQKRGPVKTIQGTFRKVVTDEKDVPIQTVEGIDTVSGSVQYVLKGNQTIVELKRKYGGKK